MRGREEINVFFVKELLRELTSAQKIDKNGDCPYFSVVREEKVVIQGISLELKLGAYEWERAKTQPVLLDLELAFPFPEEDRLEETVDYSQAVEALKGLMKEEFLLLETVAGRAARLIFDSFPILEGVRVRAHKPKAPLPLKFQDLYAECLLER